MFLKISDIPNVNSILEGNIEDTVYENLYLYYKDKNSIPKNIESRDYETLKNWLVGVAYIELINHMNTPLHEL